MWNLIPGTRFGVSLDCHAGRFSAPLLETPGTDPAIDDAGAGDPPAEDVTDDGSGAGADLPPAGNDTGDDEELEDLIAPGRGDDEDLGQITPERFKAVLKQNKKLTRKLTKALPQLTRLKGMDLDDLILRARRGDDLAATVANNPRLRALLNGGEDDPPAHSGKPAKGKPAPAAAGGDDDEEFDESKLPFDPNENDANRYFADLAKSNHELKRQLKQLVGKDTAREQQQAQARAAAERTEWKTAIDAAAETLTSPREKKLFRDALAGAYMSRGEHGKTVRQIIAHYLEDNATAADARKANAAAAAATTGKPGTPNAAVAQAATRERIANNNNNLPRTVAPGGNPAPARQGRETLSDVAKRIRNLGR